jgi:glutamate transport system substrate-binding protein
MHLPLTFRTLGIAIAGGSLLIAAASCGGDDSSSSATTASPAATAAPAAAAKYCAKATPGGSVERLCKADKIVVGTKFDQPAFGLKNPTNGKVEGFDVEIAGLIVKALGKDPSVIDFQETVSKVREDVIVNGQRDFVVATYTINDARKQKIDFAGPYYVAGQDIMVKAGNTTITDEASLDGKKVCTAAGSTPETRLKAETKAQLTTFPTYSECAEALRDGRVEAVSTDNVILLGLINQSPGDFKLVGKPFSSEPYGIGVKKGDTELRTFINDVLEASYADGSWAKAYAATIGKVDTTPAPTPPPVNRY